MGKLNHAVKITVNNYECGQCKTGVVQIISKCDKGTLTRTISGCLDCGHDYGILQASQLKPYTRNDLTWH